LQSNSGTGVNGESFRAVPQIFIRLRCLWNRSAHEPGGNCSNKWKTEITV